MLLGSVPVDCACGTSPFLLFFVIFFFPEEGKGIFFFISGASPTVAYLKKNVNFPANQRIGTNDDHFR